MHWGQNPSYLNPSRNADFATRGLEAVRRGIGSCAWENPRNDPRAAHRHVCDRCAGPKMVNGLDGI